MSDAIQILALDVLSTGSIFLNFFLLVLLPHLDHWCNCSCYTELGRQIVFKYLYFMLLTFSKQAC